jgi:hypothetical protein
MAYGISAGGNIPFTAMQATPGSESFSFSHIVLSLKEWHDSRAEPPDASHAASRPEASNRYPKKRETGRFRFSGAVLLASLLIVELNFWLWPDRHIAGNAIDFFVKVENMTFQQAMEIITEAHHYDDARQDLREDHGNVPEILR